MDISYPLCVFLESSEHGRLPVNHPFHRFIEETLQNIVQSPLVTLYMAGNTLEPFPGEVAEKQRVKEIIQYLQNSCPTISGSNSPAIDWTFVETRAYSGCGNDSRKQKVARKHVYIQKHLVDAWMQAYNTESSSESQGRFLLLTFFIKLCLLRGLTAAVNLAFTSNINGKGHTRHAVPASGSSCSFEYFLSKWNNGWLVFDRRIWSTAELPYDQLGSIVFTNRISEFRHVEITGVLQLANLYRPGDPRRHTTALQRLASGDWTAFPPVSDTPYNVFNPCCLRIWRFPPTSSSYIEKTVLGGK